MMTMFKKTGRGSMTATLLSLFFVLQSSVSWSAPQPCFSTRYDGLIRDSVDRWWRDLPDPLWWKAQLCQESRLDPNARSPVGAEGLAQFMPGTYRDVTRQLGWTVEADTVREPGRAIDAGAYYQGKLRRSWWPEGRTPVQRNELGQASYNAGLGNILKAQQRCLGSRFWSDIHPCLWSVTGDSNSHETVTYVERIAQWYSDLKGE